MNNVSWAAGSIFIRSGKFAKPRLFEIKLKNSQINNGANENMSGNTPKRSVSLVFNLTFSFKFANFAASQVHNP